MKIHSQIESIGGAALAADAVTVDDVTFTYHGAEKPALRNVSFAQSAGEMIGVMGASGAGKSTLAKCLNRIVPEFEDGDFRGTILINGEQLAHLRVCALAPKVGMVFQDFESQLFSTNVAHEVAFAMEQVGMDRAEMNRRIAPALEAVGLAGFEHRDPTSLSGGEKQRLAIASVLALRPRLIVLDEPTTDLDPEGRAAVFARSELLEECGVRPPGLGRALKLLGVEAQAENVEQAYGAIVAAYPRLATKVPDSSADAGRPDALPAATTPRTGEALVEVENVSFSYSGPRVLDSIDLRVDAGDFLAIVGQNGSGKTTLAKQIVGLLQPAAGRVMLSGKDRAKMRPAETAREVAYVFQNPDHQIFAATVEEEVAFGPRNFGLAADEIKRRCEEVLIAVGLQNERQSDPFLLSKGERQRLAVASVLVLKPQMLILDEPTTGLDHREQLRMMALVRDLNRSGIAIVIITHTPWLVAEYARRVILMRKGAKIFDGGVREFFAADELLRSSSFRPPEITELSRRFGTLALTTDEFVNWVKGGA